MGNIEQHASKQLYMRDTNQRVANDNKQGKRNQRRFGPMWAHTSHSPSLIKSDLITGSKKQSSKNAKTQNHNQTQKHENATTTKRNKNTMKRNDNATLKLRVGSK
jgi:hypothetical protein